MLEEIFENPLFIGTAFYVTVFLLLLKLLFDILRNVRLKNRVKTIVELAKVEYYYFVFVQFIIAIFAVMVSIFVYGFMQTYLGNTCFFRNYSGVIQITIIVGAILIMNMCAKIITVKPQGMDDEILQVEVTSLRLLGSIFAIVHLVFIRVYFDAPQYDSLLICYVVLVIGRFIYFDSSLKNIWSEIKKMVKHLWVVVIIIVGIYAPLFLYFFKDISISTENILFSLCVIYFAMLFGVNTYKDISADLFV